MAVAGVFHPQVIETVVLVAVQAPALGGRLVFLELLAGMDNANPQAAVEPAATEVVGVPVGLSRAVGIIMVAPAMRRAVAAAVRPMMKT